jgi:beta-galactosidase
VLPPFIASADVRDVVTLDEGWRFSLGSAQDREKDFRFNTAAFSYVTKLGYGSDGPAATGYDDRGWRTVSLPHDWGMEMPFDSHGTHNHGYRAFGPGFPDSSVGWYRRHFPIPQGDLGRKIYLECDGAFRDSMVFVNGFFCGREPSGYCGFRYDVSDYLNYGGDNVITIRLDVSTEEGWYYEGAGIYRDVRLVKTAPEHIAQDGVWVRTLDLADGAAALEVRCELRNESVKAATLHVAHTLISPDGKTRIALPGEDVEVAPGEVGTSAIAASIQSPVLWSIDHPALYTVVTEVSRDGALLDRMETHFGIRAAQFDPNRGFLLNGEVLKLKGVNLHQDNPGVGVAMTPELYEWRIRKLKEMGVNGIRVAHHPAAPALLEACDRLGMFLITENRLMGVNEYQIGQLERMVRSGRPHPSVILWSIGNEEWGIEGNIFGARIATTMQAIVHRMDPDRPCTAAISGGWGGTSTVLDVLGVNYVVQGRPDEQHRDFPWQPQLGTEESTTRCTRGVYVSDKEAAHLAPNENDPNDDVVERGWKFYAERPHTGGVFFWTGIDHKGEPNPYGWPQVGSQCGILDSSCFPKDPYYFLKAWWTDTPVLHVFPHWDWAGREGQPIQVRVLGNYPEIELFINGKSLGRKKMPVNGHLAWDVNYAPGELKAVAYRDGKAVASDLHVTTGPVAAMTAAVEKTPAIRGDGRDLYVVNVSLRDAKGNLAPRADNLLRLCLKGHGQLIGVGNGDPASHEPDRFVERVRCEPLGRWVAPDAENPGPSIAFEAVFDAPDASPDAVVDLLLNTMGKTQSAWLNGVELYRDAAPDRACLTLRIKAGDLKAGGNVLRLEAAPIDDRWGRERDWANLVPALLRVQEPAPQWTRHAFNGLAQVLVQADGKPGELVLAIESDGLDSITVPLQ